VGENTDSVKLLAIHDWVAQSVALAHIPVVFMKACLPRLTGASMCTPCRVNKGIRASSDQRIHRLCRRQQQMRH
jgi:hypothetical protein